MHIFLSPITINWFLWHYIDGMPAKIVYILARRYLVDMRSSWSEADNQNTCDLCSSSWVQDNTRTLRTISTTQTHRWNELKHQMTRNCLQNIMRCVGRCVWIVRQGSWRYNYCDSVDKQCCLIVQHWENEKDLVDTFAEIKTDSWEQHHGDQTSSFSYVPWNTGAVVFSSVVWDNNGQRQRSVQLFAGKHWGIHGRLIPDVGFYCSLIGTAWFLRTEPFLILSLLWMCIHLIWEIRSWPVISVTFIRFQGIEPFLYTWMLMYLVLLILFLWSTAEEN